MKTVEVKAYYFDELSDSAKERARVWWRNASTGDNFFAECVIDDAATIAALMGLDINTTRKNLVGGGTRYAPTVYWSGFWSQGDGACCEGTWRACDVQSGKVREYAPQDTELHRIAAEFERLALAFPETSFIVKHRGHYSHENCTVFDFRHGDDVENDTRDFDACETDLTEAARDFMRWIYRQLEAAYEWENAVEQVDDSIRANEYEFTEDGERF